MFLFGGGRRAGLFWLLFRFAVPQENTTRYQRLRGTNRISDSVLRIQTTHPPADLPGRTYDRDKPEHLAIAGPMGRPGARLSGSPGDNHEISSTPPERRRSQPGGGLAVSGDVASSGLGRIPFGANPIRNGSGPLFSWFSVRCKLAICCARGSTYITHHLLEQEGWAIGSEETAPTHCMKQCGGIRCGPTIASSNTCVGVWETVPHRIHRLCA